MRLIGKKNLQKYLQNEVLTQLLETHHTIKKGIMLDYLNQSKKAIIKNIIKVKWTFGTYFYIEQ